MLVYFRRNRKRAFIAASCAIAGVLSVVITALQVQIMKMCTPKVPKAFQ
jgi:hypothetical protein